MHMSIERLANPSTAHHVDLVRRILKSTRLSANAIMGALVVRLILLARPANGDTLSDMLNAIHKCESQSTAENCERAYLLVTELKAQLRLTTQIASLDPRLESAMLEMTGDETNEVLGHRLTVAD